MEILIVAVVAIFIVTILLVLLFKAISEKTRVETRFEAATEQNRQMLEEKQRAQAELAAYRENISSLNAREESLKQRLAEQKEAVESVRAQLKLEFQNTASQLFEDISKKFSTHSEKQIGDLLNPLRERFSEFQKTVNESFASHGKEQHSLKAEITRIVDTNQMMRLQAESLTKALRGDVKAQGNWGEVMLERILEASGLRKGEEYRVQGSEMKLRDTEGKRQHPDVIVDLADGKQIIIDSKLSLTHYDRFCSEPDDILKTGHMKDFLASIRAHVNGLAGKAYQDNEKLVTPDFVLMFLPIEGAYALAVQNDPQLHSDAWSRRVVLVCPATLFATLRTISSLWRMEMRNKNVNEIARLGGAMHDKFVGFVEDMLKISEQLKAVDKTYDKAMTKLQGQGGLISTVKKLENLGAKTTKKLPAEIVGEDGSPVLELISNVE